MRELHMPRWGAWAGPVWLWQFTVHLISVIAVIPPGITPLAVSPGATQGNPRLITRYLMSQEGI